MGGKTSTSTSAVSIPPEVLARYNSVNATAQQVAQTPFQQYSTNPSAFVQPLTPTQQAGIQNTNAAQGMAQPYYNAATGFALAGAQPVNAAPLNTGAYMNPYLNTVLGSTEAMVNQQNQQAMAGQTANAINQGYFGGDRSGIAAAVLAGQQQLTGGQLYSGIASDAYNQAMAAAQQQQGVGLEAAQANRAALTGAGQEIAGLGSTAQQTALAGAQAQLGAGQVEQQTGQAGLTALYNQFLQQQSYPFQTAQFLANIAEGTGALSGSTTTTQQPQSIFSDERLKEDMAPIGVGFDGANIYRFRYRGDPTFRVGFSAQEIARLHPEAVQVHPTGFLMVDYGRATEAAAGFARAANDDWPDEPEARRMRAAGGRIERQAGGMSEWGSYPSGANPMSIAALLQAQAQMYGPYSQAGLYGGQGAGGGPYGGVQGHVPAASLPVSQLMVAHPVTSGQQGSLGSTIHDVAGLADDVEGLKSDYHAGHEALDFFTGHHGSGGGGGGGGGGDDDVNKSQSNANGGRVGRQAGGGFGDWWTALSSGSAAQRAAANRALLAHQAALRAAQAQQRAAAARAPPTPQPSGFESTGRAPAPGSLNFGGNPNYDPGHPYGWLGDFGNWAHHADWIGTPSQVAYAKAHQGRPAAAAPAPAGRAPLVGTPAPLPTPGGPPVDRDFDAGPGGGPRGPIHPAVRAAIQQHVGQANQHMQAAHAIAANAVPTAAPTGQASPNLAGDKSWGLPTNTSAPAIPINVGDVSHLQTGFAPANLQPYHEGFLQRIGDWVGGHFGSDAQRMAYDARGMTPDSMPAPIQSAAFQNASPNMGVTHDQWLAGNAPTQVPAVARLDAAPPAVATPAVNTEPIQSRAFAANDAAHPVAVHPSVDPDIQAAARGGFARADGGAAKNPWSAVVSGSSNLTNRASRQGGGPTDPSNPQNDDPYAVHGPGLNIPTAETQHPKLATAPAPGASGSGSQGLLGQLGGAAGDITSMVGLGKDIAGAAPGIGSAIMGFLPFLGLQRGGRAGYQGGGDITPETDPATAQVEEKYAPQTVTPRVLATGASGREKPLQQVAPPDLTTPSTPLHDPAAAPPPAAGASPPAPTPDTDSSKQPGFGGAAQQPPQHEGFLPSLFHGVEKFGEGLAGMAGYEGHGQWDRDRLMPLLSAIGAAGSVPTVHPFVALAAGLGGYGKAYMQQQQNEASLDLTNAQAMQTHWQSLPPNVQRAVVPLSGPAIDPRTGQIDLRNSIPLGGGKYMHYGGAGDTVAAAYGSPSTPPGGAGGALQAGVAGSPGSAGAGVMTGPVTANYSGSGSPRYIIGPSSATKQQIAAQYGINPNGSRLENEGRASATGPDDGLRASAQKVADDYVAGSGQIGTDQATYRAMVDAASALPNKGLGAVGPGQGERQLLLQAVNTWGKALIPNFQGFSDIDANSTNTELLNKLSSIQSEALANHYGQRSYEAASQLKSVLPSGDLQKATIYDITSQMMIANERAQNFNEYRNNYRQLGLGDVGVLDAYNADTGDMYNKQRTLLPKMMANGMFQYLEKNPSEIKRVEQGYDTTDANGNPIHVNGLGPGLGKLFQ